jgi:hypothetical protein
MASGSVEEATTFDSENEAVGDVGACWCCSFVPEVMSVLQFSVPMLEHMRECLPITPPNYSSNDA